MPLDLAEPGTFTDVAAPNAIATANLTGPDGWAVQDADGDALAIVDAWIERIVYTNDTEADLGKAHPSARQPWFSFSLTPVADGGAGESRRALRPSIDDAALVAGDVAKVAFGVEVTDGANTAEGVCWVYSSLASPVAPLKLWLVGLLASTETLYTANLDGSGLTSYATPPIAQTIRDIAVRPAEDELHHHYRDMIRAFSNLAQNGGPKDVSLDNQGVNGQAVFSRKADGTLVASVYAKVVEYAPGQAWQAATVQPCYNSAFWHEGGQVWIHGRTAYTSKKYRPRLYKSATLMQSAGDGTEFFAGADGYNSASEAYARTLAADDSGVYVSTVGGGGIRRAGLDGSVSGYLVASGVDVHCARYANGRLYYLTSAGDLRSMLADGTDDRQELTAPAGVFVGFDIT